MRFFFESIIVSSELRMEYGYSICYNIKNVYLYDTMT